MSVSTTDRVKNTFLSQNDCQKIESFVSDAEKQVILSKAKKAGLSVSEYLRHAALGFPLP